MLKIISCKRDWDSLVRTFDMHDVYHTYDYHLITKKPSERIILIFFKENKIEILFPLIIRPIEDTKYYDATSTYGYSGPLVRNLDPSFNNSNFIIELRKFFIKENIICLFSRLNPFIENQETILKSFGSIKTAGTIINIDISKPLDEQKKGIQKRNRTYINSLRKNMYFRTAETCEDIKVFMNIYYQTMDRLHADSSYYFNEEYFDTLYQSTSFKTEALFAVDKATDEIMAGAMFLKSGNTVHYHLSGTKNKYLQCSPTKVLIDEMRIMSSLEGYSNFNLGGGYSCASDTLLNFKSLFSNSHLDFKIWKYVVDQDVYTNLSNEICNACDHYFPSYRCPEHCHEVINIK